MLTRVCPKCQVAKDLEVDFHVNRKSPDGYVLICKACKNAIERARYRANPQHRIDLVDRWRKRHPEKVAEYASEKYKRLKAEREKQQPESPIETVKRWWPYEQ